MGFPSLDLIFLLRKFFICKVADNGRNVGRVKKEDLGDAPLFLRDNHSISVLGCQPTPYTSWTKRMSPYISWTRRMRLSSVLLVIVLTLAFTTWNINQLHETTD